MKELDIEARTENLDEVMDFINEQLEVVDDQIPLGGNDSVPLGFEQGIFNKNPLFQGRTAAEKENTQARPEGAAAGQQYVPQTFGVQVSEKGEKCDDGS